MGGSKNLNWQFWEGGLKTETGNNIGGLKTETGNNIWGGGLKTEIGNNIWGGLKTETGNSETGNNIWVGDV